MKYIDLHSHSFKSLYIKLMFNDLLLATGTAFLAGDGERFLLFTNKHNVTGKNIITGDLLSSNGAIPNRLVVRVQDTSPDGGEGFVSRGYIEHIIPLYEDEESFLDPKWIEHDDDQVDVVGLIYNPADIDVKRLTHSCQESWYQCDVGSKVNIIGYPLGITTDGFPIWMSGYIASEPAINVDEKPLFYVDSRTRRGQSGSPVFYRIRVGDMISREGQLLAANTEQIILLGIYSGRVSEESDIGRVWKTQALRTILDKAVFEYET